MNPGQISVITDLFEKAQSRNPDLGLLFYERLSSDYPEVINIFNSVNMHAQHSRFVSMVNIILGRMNNGHPVTGLLKDLREQHQKYQIHQTDFEKFGATLIKVLREVLGSEFNAESRKVWQMFFNDMTQHMIPSEPTCHGE